MDKEIEKVMRDTGMARMQAYYHVRARHHMQRQVNSQKSNWIK